jgi:hypothetical protein
MGRLDGKPKDENGPTGGTKKGESVKPAQDVTSHAK